MATTIVFDVIRYNPSGPAARLLHNRLVDSQSILTSVCFPANFITFAFPTACSVLCIASKQKVQVNQNKRDNRKHLGGKPVKPGGKVLFSRPPNSPLLFCSIKKFTHRPGPRNTKSIIQRSTTIYCIERRSLLNAIIDSQWHSREVLKENKHILSSRHNRHCYLITTVMRYVHSQAPRTWQIFRQKNSQEDADLSLHDSKLIAHWYNTFTSWILRL